MAKSLPDQVGVAGMASCFCWLQWWWGTGFGSSKIRKLAILWCCKVIWPSSIRSSPVKWMNLGWFMLIWKVKYLRNGHWIQQNIVMNHQIYWCTIFRQTHIVCFPPFSGVSDPKWLNMKFRGWNHQTDERIRTWNTWQICQDWIGNIFKLVSWENPPFVKHPSSAIHHRRETISQMTKTVRKVLVRSKPSNTAAWWFHVDFPPYLGWSPIISP
jgi:hypothetical protein